MSNTKSKSPAFQFYPGDFLSDANVMIMSNREVGCYIKLLSSCWMEGSIPNDIKKIAMLCKEQARSMVKIWENLEPCFRELADKPGRLINPRLQKERLKQMERGHKNVINGKKGSQKRWGENKDSGPSFISTAELNGIIEKASLDYQNQNDAEKRKANAFGNHISDKEMKKTNDSEIKKKLKNRALGNSQAKETLLAKNSPSSSSSTSSSTSLKDLKPLLGEVKSKEAEVVLKFLNEVTGKKFTPSEANLKHLRGRFAEGRTVDDCKHVVRVKARQWLGTEQAQYLRPQTLFCPKNFEGYLFSEIRAKSRSEPAQEPEKPVPIPPVDPVLEKLWADCMAKIERWIEPEGFSQWFVSTRPISFDGGLLKIGTPGQLARKVLIENYQTLVESAVKSVTQEQVLVDFCVDRKLETPDTG